MDVVVQMNTRLAMIMIMAICNHMAQLFDQHTRSCHFNSIQAVLLI